MHIAIDCRLGGVAHAGIGRYISNLVQELLAQTTPELRWTIICRNPAQAKEVLGTYTSLRSVNIVTVSARHYTLSEQLQMLVALIKIRPDVLHVPHFNAPVLYWGRTIVTIHDLLWHEMRGSHVTTLPKWQYWLKYYFYKFVTKRSIVHATRVLVPSKTVKETVITFYPTAANKITVTQEGVSATFLSKRKPTYNWQKRKKTGLLYVGSLYPHKNISLILEALQKLPDATLTIVGSRSVFAQEVHALTETLGISKRVHFLGSLSDTKLAESYKLATAVVQPSRSEGFGLTGIEAMASGTPVLCSNIPIFREVYADHALYFDPYTVDSFVAAYSQLKLAKTAKKVVAAHQYARGFSWAQTAKETLEMYSQSMISQLHE